MFIGHQAVAFAAKRVAPRTSLGTLFLAAMWLDLVWPVMLLSGMEHVEIAPGDTAFTPLRFVSYPYTHSLLLVVLWAAVIGLAYGLLARRPWAALVVGALVVSHWLLDLIVHRPDLPLYPNGPEFGLGLWNSVSGTVLIEVALFAAGVLAYARMTRPLNQTGRWSLVGLVAFLIILYAANLFSPPPPSVDAIVWVGLASWLLPLWAWWVDKNRGTVSATTAPSGLQLRTGGLKP